MMGKASTFLAGLAVAFCATVCSCTTQTVDPATLQPSYVTVETNSGRILYASNCDMKRPIGMLVNIATAMVAIDWIETCNIKLDEELIAPASVQAFPRTNLLGLKPGDKLSLRDALHATIMFDDSACAATLAHACGLSLSQNDPDGAFVAQMNQLAQTLNMTGTRFKGTNGGVKSFSTARDMATLSMYAIQRPRFQAISSKAEYTVTVRSPQGGGRRISFRNSNQLVREMEGVDGLRAARSASSGSCLSVSLKHPSVKRINPRTGKTSTYGQRLLVVILGAHTSQQRYTMARNFLRDGWRAWDHWQQSDDFADSSRFINLPH